MSTDMPRMDWVLLDDAIAERTVRALPTKKSRGVYEIALRNPVNRLIRTDPDGILMIGQTTGRTQSLSTRVGALVKSAFDGKRGHSEGIRFYQLRLESKVGPLRVRWADKKWKSPIESEDELPTQYQKRYGELPPLNNSGGVKPRKKRAHH